MLNLLTAKARLASSSQPFWSAPTPSPVLARQRRDTSRHLCGSHQACSGHTRFTAHSCFVQDVVHSEHFVQRPRVLPTLVVAAPRAVDHSTTYRSTRLPCADRCRCC